MKRRRWLKALINPEQLRFKMEMVYQSLLVKPSAVLTFRVLKGLEELDGFCASVREP